MRLEFGKCAGRMREAFSTDGRYRVWVQARPRDDTPHWGAAVKVDGAEYWLTDTAGSKADAIERCQEHADGKRTTAMGPHRGDPDRTIPAEKGP